MEERNTSLHLYLRVFIHHAFIKPFLYVCVHMYFYQCVSAKEIVKDLSEKGLQLRCQVRPRVHTSVCGGQGA